MNFASPLPSPLPFRGQARLWCLHPRLAIALLTILAFPLAATGANPPANGTGKPAGTLPGYLIIRLGRGHFNRLCLAATISGKKGLMLLDTGANNTVLNEATYRALLATSTQHLPAGVPKTVRINGLAVSTAMAPDFIVGGTNLGTLPVALIPRHYLFEQSPIDQSYSRIYDGIMGENILRHYNAVVDCGRLALYLNVDPAKKLKLTSAFVQNGWTRIPMSNLDNDLTVPCVINGRNFRLIVDTGAPFTNLDRNLLRGAQVDSRNIPALRGGLIGTQPQEAGLVSLNSLQIGDFLATNVHMTTTPQSLTEFVGQNDHSNDGPILGLLGGDTLTANNAVIDIGNKALYLRRPGSVRAR